MTDLVDDNDIDRSLNPLPVLKYSTVESMNNYLSYKESNREFEDVKEVPPLALIYLRSFMERAWTWKRLVPWTVGCVLLKDYMDYLKKYLEENDFDLDLCVEAKRCLKREEKYARRFAGQLCQKDVSLSCEIINLAKKMCVPGSKSVTAAAGLRCIANEARLMSKFGTHSKMFKFSNVVRLYASKLMLYDGPEPESVAAAMLGMGKEASLALKFQKTVDDEAESYESLYVCKVVRDHTLSLLIHLTRDDELEALATSRTDMTEGYAISEKSADDDIVGNKKSKEKNKSKEIKRELEIKESEGTAESAGTVTKVSGNKKSKEKNKSKKRKRDLSIKEIEATESAGTVTKVSGNKKSKEKNKSKKIKRDLEIKDGEATESAGTVTKA